jgi:hypothetical protein
MVAIGTQMVTHMADVPAIVCVGVKRDEALAQVLASPKTLAAAVRHFGVGGAFRLITGGTRTSAIADGSTAYRPCRISCSQHARSASARCSRPHFFVPGTFEAVLAFRRR